MPVYDLELLLNTQAASLASPGQGKNVQKIAMPKARVVSGSNQIDFIFKQVSDCILRLNPALSFAAWNFPQRPNPSFRSDLVPDEKRSQFQGTVSTHFFLKTGHDSRLSFRHRILGDSLQHPLFSQH